MRPGERSVARLVNEPVAGRSSSTLVHICFDELKRAHQLERARVAHVREQTSTSERLVVVVVVVVVPKAQVVLPLERLDTHRPNAPRCPALLRCVVVVVAFVGSHVIGVHEPLVLESVQRLQQACGVDRTSQRSGDGGCSTSGFALPVGCLPNCGHEMTAALSRIVAVDEKQMRLLVVVVVGHNSSSRRRRTRAQHSLNESDQITPECVDARRSAVEANLVLEVVDALAPRRRFVHAQARHARDCAAIYRSIVVVVDNDDATMRRARLELVDETILELDERMHKRRAGHASLVVEQKLRAAPSQRVSGSGKWQAGLELVHERVLDAERLGLAAKARRRVACEALRAKWVALGEDEAGVLRDLVDAPRVVGAALARLVLEARAALTGGERHVNARSPTQWFEDVASGAHEGVHERAVLAQVGAAADVRKHEYDALEAVVVAVAAVEVSGQLTRVHAEEHTMAAEALERGQVGRDALATVATHRLVATLVAGGGHVAPVTVGLLEQRDRERQVRLAHQQHTIVYVLLHSQTRQT